jgi:predicted RND superfamily exporter protein|tara:strand:- start:93 stop:473 length:381 start_codon:yes stop_codon:yes gene_type:complete
MMKKSKTRQKLFSANSEMKKGFTMPTIKKIKSVLMSRSKTFLVNLILSMMVGMSKTAKIKVLIKIEKGTMIKRKGKKRTAKRKVVKRMSTKRKATKTRGKGFQGKKKGSKAEKMAIAKAQRARKRR